MIMKKIKRLRKKSIADIGVNDVCNIMNEFMNLNIGVKHIFTFERIGDSVLALSGFHNPSMTCAIHALCYVLDTELEDGALYTGINHNGVTFNKSHGKTWKDVYVDLCAVL